MSCTWGTAKWVWGVKVGLCASLVDDTCCCSLDGSGLLRVGECMLITCNSWKPDFLMRMFSIGVVLATLHILRTPLCTSAKQQQYDTLKLSKITVKDRQTDLKSAMFFFYCQCTKTWRSGLFFSVTNHWLYHPLHRPPTCLLTFTVLCKSCMNWFCFTLIVFTPEHQHIVHAMVGDTFDLPTSKSVFTCAKATGIFFSIFFSVNISNKREAL